MMALATIPIFSSDTTFHVVVNRRAALEKAHAGHARLGGSATLRPEMRLVQRGLYESSDFRGAEFVEANTVIVQ